MIRRTECGGSISKIFQPPPGKRGPPQPCASEKGGVSSRGCRTRTQCPYITYHLCLHPWTWSQGGTGGGDTAHAVLDLTFPEGHSSAKPGVRATCWCGRRWDITENMTGRPVPSWDLDFNVRGYFFNCTLCSVLQRKWGAATKSALVVGSLIPQITELPKGWQPCHSPFSSSPAQEQGDGKTDECWLKGRFPSTCTGGGSMPHSGTLQSSMRNGPPLETGLHINLTDLFNFRRSP